MVSILRSLTVGIIFYEEREPIANALAQAEVRAVEEQFDRRHLAQAGDGDGPDPFDPCFACTTCTWCFGDEGRRSLTQADDGSSSTIAEAAGADAGSFPMNISDTNGTITGLPSSQDNNGTASLSLASGLGGEDHRRLMQAADSDSTVTYTSCARVECSAVQDFITSGDPMDLILVCEESLNVLIDTGTDCSASTERKKTNTHTHILSLSLPHSLSPSLSLSRSH